MCMDARERRRERFRQPLFDRFSEEEREEMLENEMADDGLRVDLVRAGYPDELDFPHFSAYIHAAKPFTKGFMDIVLHWYPKLKFKAGVLHYLRETADKYDGRILIPLFNEGNKQVRWFICDAIAYNPPLDINDWVREIYLDKQYEYEETGLLPLAIIKLFPKDEARDLLRQGFDHHPGTTAFALGKIGKEADVLFLEEKLISKFESKFVYKEIEKAIKKIKVRRKIQ